jgi:hypothetical protein
MPSSIGMAIGPTRPPNHKMIKPSTPPKLSAVRAITMLTAMNVKTVNRPMNSSVLEAISRPPRQTAGRMSRVTTDEIALASEPVMAMVWANIPARTSPTRPAGSSS